MDNTYEQMVVIMCNFAHIFTGPYRLSQRNHALCVSCHFFFPSLSTPHIKNVSIVQIFLNMCYYFIWLLGAKHSTESFFFFSLARFCSFIPWIVFFRACLFAAIWRHFLLTASECVCEQAFSRIMGFSVYVCFNFQSPIFIFLFFPSFSRRQIIYFAFIYKYTMCARVPIIFFDTFSSLAHPLPVKCHSKCRTFLIKFPWELNGGREKKIKLCELWLWATI